MKDHELRKRVDAIEYCLGYFRHDKELSNTLNRLRTDLNRVDVAALVNTGAISRVLRVISAVEDYLGVVEVEVPPPVQTMKVVKKQGKKR